MENEDGGCGTVAKSSATSSRREWLHLALTLGAAVLIVTGGWVGMVYLLKTSNPITYVTGTSMLPNLVEGDLVILKGTTAQEIAHDFQAGDDHIIIVFRSPNSRIPIIHRIITIEYDSSGNIIGFRTQGYNVPVPDPGIVREQDIVGRVVYRIPAVGHVVIFFGSTVGRILGGALIVLLVIWTVVDERKRRQGQVRFAEIVPSLGHKAFI